MLPTHTEILKRQQFSTVPNKNRPGVEEPPISAYLKTNVIQPVEVLGGAGGGYDLLTWTLAVTTTAQRLRGSPLTIKGLTIRLRALGVTAKYVSIGNKDTQEFRLATAGASVDVDIDPYNIYIIADHADAPVVEILAVL